MKNSLITPLIILVVFSLLLFVPLRVDGDSSDFPMPLINPLGDMEVYNSVEFIPANELEDHWTINYNNPDGNNFVLYVWGDSWVMDVPYSDEEEPFAELEEKVIKLGGTIYHQATDQIIFNVPGEKDEIWWAIGEYPYESYTLTVVKERQLTPGKTLSFKPGDNVSQFRFSTYHQNDRYQVLKVELPTGKIYLLGQGEFATGEYQRSLYYEKELSAEKANTYYLDDFPQEQGRISWNVSWEEGAVPEGISFQLEEVSKLPKIKEGSDLGRLLVRGVDFGEIRVNPSDPISIYHPQLDDDAVYGDLTTQGEATFSLPAGLWDVFFRSDNLLGIEGGVAGLIPVNPGELTIVDLPTSLSTVFTEESITVVNKIDDALEIVRAREKIQQAEIEFSMLDQSVKEITPSLANTEVLEGGIPVKIKEIELVKTAPDVVLLLDSSGSMRGQMEATIAAARKFITTLAEDAFIQVIDFDTIPKLLTGNCKEEVLKNLDMVRADGATALYDSVLEGLNLLEGKDRPTLLVFTDGVDANFDDSGPGSEATLEEVVDAVTKANLPLFTIGFGPDHDNTVLLKLAEISSGHYYPAADPAALEKVFTAIKENLGNTYQLLYERPTVAGISDQPVIMLVVDTSASMDIPPEEEGCGYRMQKVKNLLHDFIAQLPAQCPMQVINFSHYIEIPQMMTPGKAEIYRALGRLYADGGTDIFGSTETAVRSLRPIPSTRKILIYITDAALDVGDSKEQYNALLKEIKEQDIYSIWIGLGMEEAEDVFARVAGYSGGKYVISEDPAVLADTFNEILNEVKQEKVLVEKIPLHLSIKGESESAETIVYTADKMVDFSPPPEADYQKTPAAVSYQTGLTMQYYNLQTTGVEDDDSPEDLDDSQSNGEMAAETSGLIKEIFVDIKGTNTAVEIYAHKAAIYKKISGIEAPAGQQFLALELEFKNILPEQEVIVYPDGSNHPASWLDNPAAQGQKTFQIPQYLIPDISSHLFINWNNSSINKVSEASWLVDSSLLKPGDYSLTIQGEGKTKGECIFIVPDGELEQFSLHFYDSAYGHIELPVMGKTDYQEVTLTELPTEEPVQLSESFTLKLTAVEDLDKIGNIQAGEGCLFRVIEGDFVSRVQALLDIDPAQTFSLCFTTPQGKIVLPLHPVSGYLPFGFIKPTMLAPGSFNRFRLAFMIPEYLSEQGGELYVNLKEDDVIILLGNDQPGVSDLKIKQEKYSGDGLDLIVNQLARSPEINYQPGNWVIADLTLIDQADDCATLINGLFQLLRDDYQGFATQMSMEKATEEKGLGNFTSTDTEEHFLLRPAEVNSELLLGVYEDTAVVDGTNRRVLLAFNLPDEGIKHSWTLQSPFFPNLKIPVTQEEYTEKGLLVSGLNLSEVDNSEFEQKLSMAISEATKRYQMLQAVSGVNSNKTSLNLKDESVKTIVHVPYLAFPGISKLNDIQNLEQLAELIKGIHWLPSADALWEYRYAPEAVLTQGWGTENELALISELVLTRLGYRVFRGAVELTEEGCSELINSHGLENINAGHKLPLLKYNGPDGREKKLVLPFFQRLEELSGLVVPLEGDSSDTLSPAEAFISVKLQVIPRKEGADTRLADASSVLSGGEEGRDIEEIQLISQEIALDTLSLDAIDLAYTVVGKDRGDLYSAILETPSGRLVGTGTVDSGLYKIIGECIEISLPDQTLKYQLKLEEGQGIEGVFHTVGINLPDLTNESSTVLQEVADSLYNSAVAPDELSALRWYTRSIINRFIAGQSKFEDDLARQLDLKIGRTLKSRCLMVTVRRRSSTDSVQTSIDLLRVENDIHQGSAEARQAFNIASGLFASRLEREVLPGDKKLDLFTIWQQLPDNTKILCITEENRVEALEKLAENKCSEQVIEYIQRSRNSIIIPDRPAKLNGSHRWAWLEVDLDNFYTIAVLDNGQHGSMTEKILTELIKDTTKYMIGAMLGVDIAIWSSASMALQFSDYQEILSEAEGLALEIVEMLNFYLANQADKIAEKFKIPSPKDVVVKLIPDLDIMPEVNFVQGMKDGISFYFYTAGLEE